MTKEKIPIFSFLNCRVFGHAGLGGALLHAVLLVLDQVLLIVTADHVRGKQMPRVR